MVKNTVCNRNCMKRTKLTSECTVAYLGFGKGGIASAQSASL